MHTAKNSFRPIGTRGSAPFTGFSGLSVAHPVAHLVAHLGPCTWSGGRARRAGRVEQLGAGDGRGRSSGREQGGREQGAEIETDGAGGRAVGRD